MKKLLFSILFSTWFVMALAQTFNVIKSIDFHSPPYNYYAQGFPCNSFETNENGVIGFLTFGDGSLESLSNTDFPRRIFSLKFEGNGSFLSWKRYDEEGLNQSQSFFNSQFYNGMIRNHYEEIIGVLVLNQQASVSGQVTPLRHYLARFDDEGELEDTLRIQFPQEDIEFRSYVMREDLRDSTYIIVGGYRTQEQMITNNGLLTGMIAKVDTLGNLIWWNDVPETTFGTDVAPAPNGHYCASFYHRTGFACSVNSGSINSSGVLVTFNGNGFEKDRLIYDEYCVGDITFVEDLENGNMLVGGQISQSEPPVNPNEWEASVFSQQIGLNTGGIMTPMAEMSLYFSGSIMVCMGMLKLSQSNDYLLYGKRRQQETSNEGAYLLRINEDQQLQWSRFYRHYEMDIWPQPSYYVNDVIEVSTGGFLATGYIEHEYTTLGNNEITPWLFRTDEYGCLEPGCQLVGAEELAVGLDGTVKLYPNPANEWMQLEFYFPEHLHSQFSSEDFRLNVYSVDGKLMQEEMIPREQMIQQGRMELNTSSWPEGTYLIHLSQGNVWIDSVQGVVLR